MSGPIVGGLVNKFGCRPVCILGSIVACIGLCLSTLSPNVPVLMLTYGVIGKFVFQPEQGRRPSETCKLNLDI